MNRAAGNEILSKQLHSTVFCFWFFFLLTGELLLLHRARQFVLNDLSYKQACVLEQRDLEQITNEWKKYVGREADCIKRSIKSKL